MGLEEELVLVLARVLARVLVLVLGRELALEQELALPSSWGSSSRKVHC